MTTQPRTGHEIVKKPDVVPVVLIVEIHNELAPSVLPVSPANL